MGQVTASAGMEGGEDLELSLSQKTRVRYQFESFCKKVRRGERCNYYREQQRLAAREVCFSDLPTSLLDRLCITDDPTREEMKKKANQL